MRIPSFLKFSETQAGGGAGAPAAGAAGSGAAPAGSPGAAGAPGAPAGQPGAGSGQPAGGQPAGQPGAGAGAGTTRFEYPEDRSRWIPPSRFNQVNERYRSLENQNRTLNDRVRALAGFAPEPNREHQEIRQSFGELFPELKPLLDMRPEQRERLMHFVTSGEIDDVTATTGAYWGRAANTAARDIVSKYATEINVDPKSLPPRALARMASQIRFFIEEDPTGLRQHRFEQGDPAFVDECVADMLGLFVEPVRRSLTTTVATNHQQNRQLPQQRGSSGAPGPQAGQPRTRKETSEAARQFVLSNRT